VATQENLVRVVRHGAGLEIGRSIAGRGAWLCQGEVPGLPAVPCLEQAARRQAFSRAFRAPVEPTAVAALRGMVVERARIERGGAFDAPANRRD
jgi:predicted RNA-binding protein YlxR (DUF448 family)